MSFGEQRNLEEVTQEVTEQTRAHLMFLIQRFGLEAARTMLLDVLAQQQAIIKEFTAEHLAAEFQRDAGDTPTGPTLDQFFDKKFLEAWSERSSFTFPVGTKIDQTLTSGIYIHQPDGKNTFVQVVPYHDADRALELEAALEQLLRILIQS